MVGCPSRASHRGRTSSRFGQRLRDVKYVLTSHAHFDHVGGVAALQRRTADVSSAAPPPSRLRSRRTDERRPAVSQWQPAGDTVPSGGAGDDGARRRDDHSRRRHVHGASHPRPTPGATTWSWRSCEGAHCVDVVYADSLQPESPTTAFRFTDHPGLVEQFRRSIEVVEGLPCDVIVTVHPDFMALDDKLATRGETVNPFVEPSACRRYGRAGSAEARRAARG